MASEAKRNGSLTSICAFSTLIANATMFVRVLVVVAVLDQLLALREQVGNAHPRRQEVDADYDTKDRSLANTMRALRRCMRNLAKYADSTDDLLHQLACAQLQQYNNHRDKKARRIKMPHSVARRGGTRPIVPPLLGSRIDFRLGSRG